MVDQRLLEVPVSRPPRREPEARQQHERKHGRDEGAEHVLHGKPIADGERDCVDQIACAGRREITAVLAQPRERRTLHAFGAVAVGGADAARWIALQHTVGIGGRVGSTRAAAQPARHEQAAKERANVAAAADGRKVVEPREQRTLRRRQRLVGGSRHTGRAGAREPLQRSERERRAADAAARERETEGVGRLVGHAERRAAGLHTPLLGVEALLERTTRTIGPEVLPRGGDQCAQAWRHRQHDNRSQCSALRRFLPRMAREVCLVRAPLALQCGLRNCIDAPPSEGDHGRAGPHQS